MWDVDSGKRDEAKIKNFETKELQQILHIYWTEKQLMIGYSRREALQETSWSPPNEGNGHTSVTSWGRQAYAWKRKSYKAQLMAGEFRANPVVDITDEVMHRTGRTMAKAIRMTGNKDRLWKLTHAAVCLVASMAKGKTRQVLNTTTAILSYKKISLVGHFW